MKRVLSIMACLVGLLLATESATAKKRIVVNSEPSGAQVYINGIDTHQTTPTMIPTPGGKYFSLSFKKEGYEEGKSLVSKKKNFDGKKAYPEEVNYRLTATPYKTDPTIRAGEATNMVSRDKPGSTALERTIIRWNFDSEPRGARISWRVISSIPDAVKNTNETYLTTTPYEETRSFNILGLTYENARDVTIEVKLSKSGYYDQVKRYNVRQAIDQQEISGFFDLVKREEE